MINKTTPRNRDYSRDPNIKTFKRSKFINYGSTLCTLIQPLQPFYFHLLFHDSGLPDFESVTYLL